MPSPSLPKSLRQNPLKRGRPRPQVPIWWKALGSVGRCRAEHEIYEPTAVLEVGWLRRVGSGDNARAILEK